MQALGAALDPSHHPFKRSLIRPGGPRHKRDAEVAEWTCEWKKPYVQTCYNIHHPERKPKEVKIKKGNKKKYNKAYRAGKFPKGGPFKKDVRAGGAAYQPRKSKPWAARSKSKRARR